MNLYIIAQGIIKSAKEADKSHLPYIATAIGGKALIDVGNSIYGNNILPILSKADEATYNKLVDYAIKKNLVKDVLEGKLGDTVLKGKKHGVKYDFGTDDSLTNSRGAAFITVDKKIAGEKLYNDLHKTIINTERTSIPGTIAHEIGHAMDYAKRDYTKGYKFGVASAHLAPILPALVALSGADDNTVLAAGLGSSLLTAPVHRAELQASINGYKLLRKFGKGRLGALAAFAGYPTYLAGTLGPNLLPWAAKKIGDAYNS